MQESPTLVSPPAAGPADGVTSGQQPRHRRPPASAKRAFSQSWWEKRKKSPGVAGGGIRASEATRWQAVTASPASPGGAEGGAAKPRVPAGSQGSTRKPEALQSPLRAMGTRPAAKQPSRPAAPLHQKDVLVWLERHRYWCSNVTHCARQSPQE